MGTYEIIHIICIYFNCLKGSSGGWGGIRTPDRVAPMPVFKTGAFNHSATHPLGLRGDRGFRSAYQAYCAIKPLQNDRNFINHIGEALVKAEKKQVIKPVQ